MATQVATAAHSYASGPQPGTALSMLNHHPVLNVVAHLLFLGMALSLGAVIVAALVKPPVD